ncbi:MAG: RidA family protein [Betaproteobacteria bacterium]|nr:RidA family protein [Betaproteobacteria bacterium]
MTGRIDSKLKELNLTLPGAAAAFATYTPWKVHRGIAYISGQGPLIDGKPVAEFCGKVGRDVTPDQGRRAAELTALNILAQLRLACGGDLDRVSECLQLAGYVNCVDDFKESPAVVNGASKLIVDVLGQAGMHSRLAVCCNALPFGIAVEISAIFAID